jgi:GNAT superfamily N-acetyltransferase
LSVREYVAADEPEVLHLLSASMGWVPDTHHRDYFRWKHQQSPFGASPAWVATDGDRVAGFRTFMRWEFRRDDEVVRAVRAVDTATHPDHQGRGIFSLLTRHALAQFEAEGVDFVFNTPNSKSRPGYLKMGWVDVGAIPVRMRPAMSPRSIVRVATSRAPAERWSLPTSAGLDARAVLDGGPDGDRAVAALIDRSRATPAGHLTTNRSVELLRWRYCGFAPLAYRCLLNTEDPADGLLVFRLRRRAKAVEAVVNTVLLPDQHTSLRPLLRRLLRETGADYVLRIGSSAGDGLVRLPGQGPMLTFRRLREAEPPPLDHWELEMGDIELF